MEMFLMVLSLSLLGVGVSAALFAAATRDERRAEEYVDTRIMSAAEASRFFVDTAAPRPARVPGGIPAEVLLLQIERHVRLEQAAAEAFHQFPTIESLRMRTTSPLVH